MRWLVAVLTLAALQTPAAKPSLALTVAARSIQPGELVVLTVVTNAPVDAIRARAFDRDLMPFKIDSLTWRVLVGIDLETKPGAYSLVVSATPTGGPRNTATHMLEVAEKTFATRTLKVDDAFVNPPESAAARIAEDTRDLARCWANPTRDRLWTGVFVRPVPQEANSAFGSRSVFNGQARSPHSGADFRSPAGTPVQAPNAGRVMLAKDLYFSGGTVVIDHGAGLFSLFAHLSTIEAKVGTSVATGDVVGKVGATGRVTGAHLHWTVRATGARVDPLSLLATLGEK